MKNNFLSLVALFLFIQCNSQEKETVYLLFDSNSEKFYENEYDRMKHSKKIYRENNNKENIDFYIYEELFRYNKKEKLVNIIDIDSLKIVEFSSIDFINKKWKESNLFSKRNVFDTILLVKLEKDKKSINVYEVKWVDYIK